jgi:zinc protease
MLRSILTLSLTVLLYACSEQSVVDTDRSMEAGSGDALGEGASPWTLLETVDANSDEILIPYKKYLHQNGLTVLLHDDDSDPLVHVNITYHVGSAREEPQRSGFAHFFEHMMFQGSANVGDDEHFQIVTEVGGTLNGSTSTDRTNYFQTIPVNQLETILWLEADRMGFLLEAVTQEKFEIQRSTVKNERGQNVENRPYGRVYEQLIAAMYPSGHPYSWPVIGYPEDLDAATLDDLRHFFLRWYGPNNATLIVAGNLDEDATLRMINKYFGSIPTGPAVERAMPESISLDGNRYVSYVDQNIRFPLLLMSFPSVPYAHPDRIPLSALASILGGGRKSVLYQQFVLNNRALDASASNGAQELGGMFSLEVQAFPDGDLASFEADLREILASFGPDSISAEDLETFKGQTEANLINGLQSVQGKASRLALYDYLIDNPNYLPQEIAAVRSLTEADILRVFNQYIAGKPAVLLSVLSRDNPDAQAQPDNFTAVSALRLGNSELDDLEPRPVMDNFDRAVRPGAGQTPLVEVPPFWREDFANGARLIGTRSTEIPTITMRMSFRGGHLLNAPEHYGLARLTAAMLNEGTRDFSAEQFEVELQKLGSSINVSAGQENMTVTVNALSRNLAPTLDLLEQRLLYPQFTEADLERLRRQQVESLQAARDQPSRIASAVFDRLLYGAEHSFAVPIDGRIETLEAIGLDDIENFRRESMATDNLQIVVVGDVEQQTMVAGLTFLDAMPRESALLREQPQIIQSSVNTLYLVDKPGAAQSEIRIGYVTDMPYDASGDYFKSTLMNYVLGGAFSSRINLNLREDKGYTYGARSSFFSTRYPGPFTASSSVRMDSSADSVRQFINEIATYRESGITAQELDFMRAAIGQRDALSYETPGQKSGFLGRILEYDLTADYVREQSAVINTISQEEINTFARDKLPLERMVILVVGDKAVIADSLLELGYPIVELDTAGNPIESTDDLP